MPYSFTRYAGACGRVFASPASSLGKVSDPASDRAVVIPGLLPCNGQFTGSDCFLAPSHTRFEPVNWPLAEVSA